MSEVRKSFKDLGKLGKRIKGKKAAIDDFIPIFLALIDEIERRGLDVEGILRISGSLPEITGVKKSLLKGSPPDISKMDIHVATGLMKALLRELSEPLLLFNNYEQLLKASVMKDIASKVKVLKAIVLNLPAANREVLIELLTLAVHITNREETNRMSPHNVAVVLGPTILRAHTESLESMMRDSMQVVKVVEDLIDNFSAVFDIKTIDIEHPVSLNLQETEFLRKRAASLFPSSQEKTTDEWTKDVTKLKSQLAELELRLADDTREKEILHTYKSSLESKLAVESDQVAALSESLAGLKKENEDLTAHHSQTLDSLKSDHERQVSSLETQLNDKTRVIISLEKATGEMKQQFATLKTNSSSHTQKLSLMESKLSTAETQASEAHNKVKDLQAQLSASESKLTVAEKKNSASEAKISEMEAKISKAEKSASNDANLIKEKTAAVERLEKRNSELTAEYSALQKAKGDNEVAQAKALAAANSLASQTRESEESQSTLHTKIKTLETENVNLQNQYKVAVEKSNKFEKDLKKFEVDVKRSSELVTKAESDVKKANEDKRLAETELKKAQLEVKALLAENESFRKELSDALDVANTAEADERARSAAAIKKVREERSQTEIQLKKAQLENANLQTTNKTLATAKAALAEENALLKGTQKSHSSALRKLQTEKDNIESELRQNIIMREGENKKYQQDSAAAASTIKRFQGDKATLEAEVKKLQAEKAKLTNELEVLKADKRQTVVAGSSSPSPAKSSTAGSDSTELIKLKQEKEQLQTQLKKAHDDLDKTLNCVTNLEKQVKALGAPTSPASLSLELKKTQEANKKLTDENKRLSTRTGGASSSSPSSSTADQKVQKELSEQLFSWMSLCLKLQAASQGTSPNHFDSQGLLALLLAEKVPYTGWPEQILKHMDGKA